uniref:BEACH domain-containing protein n=1 Tax=Oryza glumipatula TaxID=40148 RepID=A0A0D9Y7P3_9ORYZ
MSDEEETYAVKWKWCASRYRMVPSYSSSSSEEEENVIVVRKLFKRAGAKEEVPCLNCCLKSGGKKRQILWVHDIFFAKVDMVGHNGQLHKKLSFKCDTCDNRQIWRSTRPCSPRTIDFVAQSSAGWLFKSSGYFVLVRLHMVARHFSIFKNGTVFYTQKAPKARKAQMLIDNRRKQINHKHNYQKHLIVATCCIQSQHKSKYLGKHHALQSRGIIISALAYLHDFGVHHGNLKSSTIFIRSVQLLIYVVLGRLVLQGPFILSYFKQWWMGEFSNCKYIFVLNKLVGRMWGDPAFHTVTLGLIDFTVRPDENSGVGWKDLTKSKWRLAKSKWRLAKVCSYKSRRLPKNILRLYLWTPDECIPELDSDPRIFFSLHSEMRNFALLCWVTYAEEFICLHRDAIESDLVSPSRQLHHWIDITFGYKLSGEAYVEAKNQRLNQLGEANFSRNYILSNILAHFTLPIVIKWNLVLDARGDQVARLRVLLNDSIPPVIASQIDNLEEFEQTNLSNMIIALVQIRSLCLQSPESMLSLAPVLIFVLFLNALNPMIVLQQVIKSCCIGSKRLVQLLSIMQKSICTDHFLMLICYLHKKKLAYCQEQSKNCPSMLLFLFSYAYRLQREWKRRPLAKHPFGFTTLSSIRLNCIHVSSST